MRPLDEPLSDALLREPLRNALRARARAEIPVTNETPAAVLVPLSYDGDDVTLWLVRRPVAMRRHSGQVAFPGGKVEEGDASRAHTALREAEEEIGLAPSQVDILGSLDDLVTGTGYVITPVVAWVHSAFMPVPQTSEVDRAFRAPLRTFSTRASGVFPRIGHTVDGEFVWGATFAMARSLAQIVSEIVAGRPT